MRDENFVLLCASIKGEMPADFTQLNLVYTRRGSAAKVKFFTPLIFFIFNRLRLKWSVTPVFSVEPVPLDPILSVIMNESVYILACH